MTANYKIDTSQLKAKIADLKLVKHKAAPILFQEFYKNTPVGKTGNARSHTTLQGDEIVANYPYAFVLDAGRGFRDGQMRGSTQAPDGMTKPTEALAQKLLPQLIQQISNRRK
jgi:hypothetical protein